MKVTYNPATGEFGFDTVADPFLGELRRVR